MLKITSFASIVVFLLSLVSISANAKQDQYNCEQYKLSKEEKLASGSVLRKEKETGREVLKELQQICPSPYISYTENPEKVISIIDHISEVERYVCLNENNIHARALLKYYTNSKDLVKSCLDEYRELINEWLSYKDTFEDDFRADIKVLEDDQGFDLPMGSNVIEAHKESNVLLYESDYSFRGFPNVNTWVKEENDNHKEGHYSVRRYYGIDNDGYLQGYVFEFDQRTNKRKNNENMGECDIRRNKWFPETNYIKIPQAKSSEVNKKEVYFSVKNVISAICSSRGREYTLRIMVWGQEGSVLDSEITEEFSIYGFQEYILEGKSVLAQKYFLQDNKRKEEKRLIEKSEEVIRDFVRVCPSPIDTLSSGKIAVSHIYRISVLVNPNLTPC